MADLGSDIGGVEDVDANLTMVSGRLCLLQAVARRWLTARGGLFYDRAYGGGVVDLLSGEMVAVGELASRLESQALEDERVDACSVSVTFVGRALRIRGSIADAAGPFPFTIDLSQTGAVVLSEVG